MNDGYGFVGGWEEAGHKLGNRRHTGILKKKMGLEGEAEWQTSTAWARGEGEAAMPPSRQTRPPGIRLGGPAHIRTGRKKTRHAQKD